MTTNIESPVGTSFAALCFQLSIDKETVIRRRERERESFILFHSLSLLLDIKNHTCTFHWFVKSLVLKPNRTLGPSSICLKGLKDLRGRMNASHDMKHDDEQTNSGDKDLRKKLKWYVLQSLEWKEIRGKRICSSMFSGLQLIFHIFVSPSFLYDCITLSVVFLFSLFYVVFEFSDYEWCVQWCVWCLSGSSSDTVLDPLLVRWRSQKMMIPFILLYSSPPCVVHNEIQCNNRFLVQKLPWGSFSVIWFVVSASCLACLWLLCQGKETTMTVFLSCSF
jgi:hypothetical protein